MRRPRTSAPIRLTSSSRELEGLSGGTSAKFRPHCKRCRAAWRVIPVPNCAMIGWRLRLQAVLGAVLLVSVITALFFSARGLMEAGARRRGSRSS